MALWITHAVFSLALAEIYGVKNVEEFIAGKLYPDTRYLTKKHRGVTHPNLSFFSNNMTSDFYKGWHSHIICDLIQAKFFIRYFNDLDSDWETRTALKILQDRSDSKNFDRKLLETGYVFNPNRENTDTIKNFYEVIIALYESNLENRDYHDMWVDLGVAHDKVDKVISNLERIQELPDVGKKIATLSEKMIDDAKNFFCNGTLDFTNRLVMA
jgi:hypothetical protein